MSKLKLFFTKIVIIYLVVTFVNSQSDEEEEDEDIPSDEESTALRSVVNGNSKFAKKLYFLLSDLKQNENFVSSPYSLTLLLGMLRSGSTGGRKSEIQEALQMADLNNNVFNEGISILAQEFPEIDEIEYKSLQRIYVPSSYQIKPKYLETITENFQSSTSSVRSMDFSKSVTAAEKINSWISQKTKGNLQSIISPDSIFKDTKLVLISAVYFESFWENRFTIHKPDNGTQHLFFVNDTHATETTMMTQHGLFKYADLPKMRSEAVAIPFAGERLEFVMIIPKNRNGLSYILEQKMKGVNTTFESVYSTMKPRNIKLTIPKFDMDSLGTYTYSDKNSMLAKIGLNVRKDQRGLLDYNAMTPFPGLYLDKMIVKLKISISEQGSKPEEIPQNENASSHIRVEHPFIFYVYDTETKAILIQGRKLV